MEMTIDAENITRNGIESDSAIATSVCDGSYSPGGSQSSREGGSKRGSSSERLVGSLADTPNDESSKVPEVLFKEGHSEKVVDHPAAVTNLALDGVEVGLRGKGAKKNEEIVLDNPDQADFEVNTETSEGAVVGRSNDAMDDDDICDTSF